MTHTHTITIDYITIKENKISVGFDTSENLNKYFTQKLFSVEYSENIEKVPNYIGIIPFLVNILPIVWVSNSTLIVDELDADFYDSIEEFKKGYIQMFPMVEFKGELIVKNRIKSLPKEQTASATFFSGGVDAFSTLFAHIDEKPTLITIWGADIKLNDIEGWKNVWTHTEQTSKLFDLNAIAIKSTFRSFIDSHELNKLVKVSGDGWWHGFQHGIGLIGHAAPVSYTHGFKQVYIASSHTLRDDVPCASHPTIDNFVRFCNTRIIHDQYECTRQKKIERICKYTEKSKLSDITLRVCWISSGGSNCCKCEKCYRTLLDIIVEGKDPNLFGFTFDTRNTPEIKRYLKTKQVIKKNLIFYWTDIQEKYIRNKEIIEYPDNMEWLANINFNRINQSLVKNLVVLYRLSRDKYYICRHYLLKYAFARSK